MTSRLNSLADAAPRLTATVMLLRDGDAGLEVLLLKRHLRSDVHGGVHVFPGGKVDETDAMAAATRFGDGVSLLAGFASAALTPARAAILYTAALRELQEECNVCIEDVSVMHPHSRWITPALSTSSKRFDTWFFVALLPHGAVACHDDYEAVESIWLRPRDAIGMFRDGAIQLAPPQIMSLAALSHQVSARAALDSARSCRPPLIQPEHVGTETQRIIAFPGDIAHSVSTPALTGPTRLVLRNERYEPEDGFDALLGRG
ncbi:NUDIX domain-containing protein [Variovorax sp. J22P168]|uniref:NUDIX hydrolase n=1 Tax=Variovorax jilinensis TaxID=3053513 RepID=UPI0025785948|nr:NUDIX domain-containing protein [Variovorax sp. J22P168]MDM0015164.1 NUDIX domain-containing protein [Variovorax sp. J22P168]